MNSGRVFYCISLIFFNVPILRFTVSVLIGELGNIILAEMDIH